MKATKILLIAICTIHLSCSEFSFEQPEATFTEKFQKEKGKMLPVERFDYAYVGCPKTREIFFNSCCYAKDTQTYQRHGRLIVRGVAEGMVVKALMTNVNGIVIIKHGSYLSVYRNLDEIKVEEGKRIRLGDIIGYAGLNYAGTYQELQFELYNKSEKLHPTEWLLN